LSFSLQAGRILGFLGPNGAGKTTAIRILTTMMEPDAGRFVVNGISSEHPESIRRFIGVLPENLGFPKQITGLEYLTYFGQLYGRPPAQARAHALALLEEVGLEKRGKSLIAAQPRDAATAGDRSLAVNGRGRLLEPPWAWIRAASRSR
jgi:ABC-2 type transport system ATP-binding protein